MELVIVRVLFLGVAPLTGSQICETVVVAIICNRAVASLRHCHGDRIVDAASRSHQGLPGGRRSLRRLRGESGRLAKCVVCRLILQAFGVMCVAALMCAAWHQ